MRDKELKDWYRQHHICVMCGRADAEPGRKHCKACLQHERERNALRRDQTIARRRELRKERSEAGLCLYCGKPATPGKQLCMTCRMRQNDSVRKYRIIKKIDREVEKARLNSGKDILRGSVSLR